MSTVQTTDNVAEQNGQPPMTAGRGGGKIGIQSRAVMFPRADHSPERHGAINTATTDLNTEGVTGFKADIFRYIQDTYQQRQSVTPPLQDLSPAVTVNRAAESLLASCPLASPLETVAELKERYRELQILGRGHPSSFRSQIQEAAQIAVNDRFETVLDALQTVVRESPLTLKQLTSSVGDFLDRLEYSEVPSVGLSELSRLHHLLAAFEHDTMCIPVHKREVLTRHALQHAQESCQRQLSTLVAAEVKDLFQKAVADLRNRCDEWAKLAQSCADHLDAVQRALLEDVRQAKFFATAGTAEGRIVLAGPSQQATLKSLCRSYDCTGAELVKRLSHAYVVGLQELLSEELNENHGPLEVFRLATADDGLAVLRDLIDGRLEGLSIYVAIEKYGVDQLVSELVPAAGPLVHLCRSNVINNIEPALLSILTVPPPVGTRDGELLEQLKSSVRKAFKATELGSVEFCVSPTVGQSCHLTRSIMGYPAAAQSENHALAWAYVKSLEIDHCCHLFGALPDSPDGKASEIVAEILNQLKQEQ